MDNKPEFLLGLSSAKLAQIEKALERNWAVQLVAAGIGLALVFDIGDLPKFLAKYVSQDQYNLQPVATILLAILFYYFMKFGQLLTAFIDARRLNDSLLAEYLGRRIEDKTMDPLRQTTSFFEGYYSPEFFGAHSVLRLAYLLVTPFIMSAGQAAALYLIARAYKFNPWSLGALAVVVTLLALLYIEFWKSKKHHHRVWCCAESMLG